MKEYLRGTVFKRSAFLQGVVIALIWLGLVVLVVYYKFIEWDNTISVVVFISVPAAVIGVAQLLLSAHVQRAAYIKDYALRFRTDKELSESFHYLVYRFGNTLYAIYKKPGEQRSHDEKKELLHAQKDVADDLKFFDPKAVLGVA